MRQSSVYTLVLCAALFRTNPTTTLVYHETGPTARSTHIKDAMKSAAHGHGHAHSSPPTNPQRQQDESFDFKKDLNPPVPMSHQPWFSCFEQRTIVLLDSAVIAKSVCHKVHVVATTCRRSWHTCLTVDDGEPGVCQKPPSLRTRVVELWPANLFDRSRARKPDTPLVCFSCMTRRKENREDELQKMCTGN